jgi:hypothetical protein
MILGVPDEPRGAPHGQGLDHLETQSISDGRSD